jgi:hypothetical protein
LNASLLQRQAALAGVALLAAVGGLALGRDEAASPGPADAFAPATSWRTASVGISKAGGSQCGQRVDETTAGVVHPVLPCRAKLVVQGGGRTIRTEVVGRSPVGLRHAFDLTPALAARLGVSASTQIRWRFAE